MTLDANIVIAYLEGEQDIIDALATWRQQGRPLFLSTVAETEILSFSKFTPLELLYTEKFLEENFTSIPFDRAVAKIAAGIRRDTKLKFPDAAIAATALFTYTPLITRNIRDFKKVPSLSLLKI